MDEPVSGTQRCPICDTQVANYPRYPRYVCNDCLQEPARAPDGRVVAFGNVDISGGIQGRYAATGEPYNSHECFVRGVKCWADQARFGGIVIQAAPVLSWSGSPAHDFLSLLRAAPADAFDSATRSTLPLLDFFREPHVGLTTLEHVLQIGVDGIPCLTFESAQPVVQGRGKPSYTDLLVRGASTTVAIEAKYTEPRYRTVQEWLAISPEGNRPKVLAGWLSLIQTQWGGSLAADTVLNLPYQLIHRTASLFAAGGRKHGLVYMIFGPTLAGCYRSDLSVLCRAIGHVPGFSAHLVHIAVDSSPELARLVQSRRSGEASVGEEVRAAMIKGRLYSPSWPAAQRVWPPESW